MAIFLRVFLSALALSGILHAQISPYTLHLKELIRSGTDGSVRVAANVVIAQRSDGARCELYIKLPGEKHEHRLRILQLADMRQIRAWDGLGLKATSKEVRPSDAAMLKSMRADPNSECATTFGGRPARPAAYRKSGRRSIEGIDAIRFVDGNGGENWYAPKLGCEQVYMKRAFPAESSETIATSYSLGEPDPSLFDVAGLRETTILEAEETNLRRLGVSEAVIDKQLAGLRARAKQP